MFTCHRIVYQALRHAVIDADAPWGSLVVVSHAHLPLHFCNGFFFEDVHLNQSVPRIWYESLHKQCNRYTTWVYSGIENLVVVISSTA